MPSARNSSYSATFSAFPLLRLDFDVIDLHVSVRIRVDVNLTVGLHPEKLTGSGKGCVLGF